MDWQFMDIILKQFGFPPLITKRIMACVSSTSFSIGVNWDINGFFKGKRRLRQGDPLSPYLLTLVMEVLTLIMQRRVRVSDSFRFHKYCEDLHLLNVCFVDDLFIFVRSDVDSARVIRESLEEFTRVSGLVPSLPKITNFFYNVANHVKLAIPNTIPFSEGKLPVIYLGVPLIPTRLFNRDCKFLVEKARNRIGDWKNKSLSFAGRLQLCNSVIFSMHVYWASVLMIPTGILLDIEQLMRGFLWCNHELKCGKEKVAWNTICLPKSEGGLGIRSLEMFNIALITTHIWNIVSNKESIWVHWINAYKLKGFSFWDVPLKNYARWTWCKLIRIRDLFRPFFWKKIGNGHGTSLNTLLLDTNMEDAIWWRDGNGNLTRFSVKAAWDAFRNHGTITTWHCIVWFSHNVPRHAFLLWFIIRNSLKTQDKLWQWDVGMDFYSPPCWYRYGSARIEDIFSYLQPIAHQRTVLSVIGRLLLAASAYYIWDERNKHVFKQVKRSWTDIRDIIITTIRLKLFTLKFKNKARVFKLLAEWKMLNNFRLYGS
nr:hypothetical protein [Tanacetum cinerariifolium]